MIPRTPSSGLHQEPLLTVKDVAQRCSISTRTVHRLVASGLLQVIRIGRSVRISPNALSTLTTEAVS